MEKNFEIRGGHMSGGGDDEKGKRSSKGTFVVKQREDKSGPCIEVVRESLLGAFFRQDYEMCSCPEIRIRETNEEPTVFKNYP